MIVYPIYKTKTKYCLILSYRGMIKRHYSKKKSRLEALIAMVERLGGYCIICEWPKGQKTEMLKYLASQKKMCSINL